MICDCCTTAFLNGLSVCPSCRAQAPMFMAEREAAQQAVVRPDGLSEGDKVAVSNRMLNPAELGFTSGFGASLRAKNPARRAVFRLLGIYLPEAEAREVIRKIHDFKWIEAEKAGFDIWSSHHQPEVAFKRAAKTWADSYLGSFLGWKGERAA
jgi:hypothetical protein